MRVSGGGGCIKGLRGREGGMNVVADDLKMMSARMLCTHIGVGGGQPGVVGRGRGEGLPGRRQHGRE